MKHTKKILTETEPIVRSIERLEAKMQEKDFSDAENHEEALDELSSAVIALESFVDILERDDENEEMKKYA